MPHPQPNERAKPAPEPDQVRDRSNPFDDPRRDLDDPDTHRYDETNLDAGAFIGHEPELSRETIPGGLNRRDERVSALDTQSTGVGAPERRGQPELPPAGHREGAPASDAQVREAGDSPE